MPAKWIGSAAIAIAVAALTLLLRHGGNLARLEHQAEDARSAILKREVASDIVIVGIDARSLAELHTWPWPRRYHAALLKQLRAAAPAQVFVDVDFSSPSAPLDDASLQAELRQWSPTHITLPEFFQPASGNDTRLLTTRPLPALAQSVRLGAVNQIPDQDGLVRRFRSSWQVDGRLVPAAATLLAKRPSASVQELLIDYSITPASFNYLSYVDVLNGDFDPASLRGKTIVVGATASELNDMLSVPLYQALAGCIVQALAAQTLIAGSLYALPESFYLVALSLWAALCVLLLSGNAWRRNLLLLAAGSLLPLLVGTLLYSFGRIALESVPWMLITVACFTATTIRSLDRETLRALAFALGIRRSDALMASIVEFSVDGILCVDRQGMIRTANPASAALLECEPQELQGSNIGNFIRTMDRDSDWLSSLIGGQNEAEIATAQGRTLPIEYSVCRVGLRDEQLYTVIVRDIRDRRAQERKLQYQATHDSLTMLPNRAATMDYLERALAVARPGEAIALMMLDLCRFKEVNDTLGHNVGDAVLREVAGRFRSTVGDRGLLARIGGDEFTVVIDRQADAAAVEQLASALTVSTRAPIPAGNIGIDLGVSIGVAWFPRDAGDAQSLLKNADVAMYVAKRNGNAFEHYDATRDEHSVRKLTMAAELRSAIAQERLQLYFQPQVNLHNGRVESAEALLRWQHPLLGEISPTEFIAIAEATDLIQPLTHWALRRALQHAAEFHSAGIELRLAVNISARMLQDVLFAQQLRSLLEPSGVAASSLELEITESAMMLDPARALKVVQEINSLGVVVSVDDYGTGFSSLAYLRDLPIKALKLDKSFVISMLERQEDRAIVESTAQLAHALRLQVVAEGVETQWHAHHLAALGYDYAQGYYYSRALTPEAFVQWLQHRNSAEASEAFVDELMTGAA